MIEPIERIVDVGIGLYVREWAVSGTKRPFLLVHGLASNARTWDGVARYLAQAGHPVTAVDQRGHGLSEKPSDGYDFATITADIYRLLELLGWRKPALAGQSWGGNVLLEFGARYPNTASHLIFVDGGFLELHQQGSWKTVSAQLKPPDLDGMPRDQLKSRISSFQPEWNSEGVEATLHNFETLPDGTIRPWLTLEKHMTILHALYAQRPRNLYPQLQEPLLICAADDGSEWTKRKREQLTAATNAIPQAAVQWFANTAHDIHVHRPQKLAQTMLKFVGDI